MFVIDDVDEAVEGVGVVRTKFSELRLFYDVHDSMGARQVSFDAAFSCIMSKIARELRENGKVFML